MSLISRFILWSPDFVKESIRGLYRHLEGILEYHQNEDGVYVNEKTVYPFPFLSCRNKQCPSDPATCWHEFNAYLTQPGITGAATKELLEEDLNLHAVCQKHLLAKYCVEEIVHDIECWRNTSPEIKEESLAPAFLKITDQADERMMKWEEPNDAPDLSEWERDYCWETTILRRMSDGYSRVVLNDIKKAYGIVRRTGDANRFYRPEFVANCLMTATIEIDPINYIWSTIHRHPDEQLSFHPYFYFLRLDQRNHQWRLECQKDPFGIFLLDEWEVKIHPNYEMNADGIDFPFDLYGVLKKNFFDRK